MEQVETMSCQECKHFHENAVMYLDQCDFCFKDCKYEPKDEPQKEIEIIACPIVDEFEMCERMYRDEPQTNADQHVQRVESVEPMWTKEEHEAFYTFLWNVINPNEMQDYIEMFETKDEPQTEEWYTYQDEQEYNDRWQTERSE